MKSSDNPIQKLKSKTKSTQLSKEISYHLTHPLTTERTKINLHEKSITSFMQLQTDYISYNNLIFNLNKKG